jgi:hypothetical protein
MREVASVQVRNSGRFDWPDDVPVPAGWTRARLIIGLVGERICGVLRES